MNYWKPWVTRRRGEEQHAWDQAEVSFEGWTWKRKETEKKMEEWSGLGCCWEEAGSMGQYGHLVGPHLQV